MDKLIGALARVGELKVHCDDDFVDRLNRRYTTTLLIVFALLVSTKQYVGEPISCWVPAQFTPNHETYANKVCWVSNTYYLPFTKIVPDKWQPKEKIGYYQWIPMILICQATMFYLPCSIWRILNRRSGVNMRTVMDAAMACQKTSLPEARDRTMKYILHHLDSYFNAKKQASPGCWSRIKKAIAARCFLIFGKIYGNYLTYLYLATKLLYIANSVGQLFLLNMFLGTEYHLFGIRVMTSLLKRQEWQATKRFPRVTLCDFEVRQLANVHRHTVQCVLPINLFNEKIYVFIWFWFVFVAGLTIFSFLYWFFKAVNKAGATDFIKSQLRAFGQLNRETEVQATKFSEQYLRQDGAFIMRLVSKNAGDLIMAEILAGLWDVYGRERRFIVDRRKPRDRTSINMNHYSSGASNSMQALIP